MIVELIDKMGNDLTVVNAARVSFSKQSSYDYDPHEQLWVLKEADERLIAYLARHGHWSPFAHPQITLRIKAPLFVARQLQKHQVGLAWNEVSRRYVDSEPEFYVPDGWRKRAEHVKQGSSDELTKDNDHFRIVYAECSGRALGTYEGLIAQGVCPEQARMVLPQSMMTEWFWTGSLYAFSRVVKQRLESHAQRETQEIAKQIARIVEPLYPISWKELVTHA